MPVWKRKEENKKSTFYVEQKHAEAFKMKLRDKTSIKKEDENC